MSVTKELVEFVTKQKFDTLPEWSVIEAKRTLINYIAISLSASQSHDAEILFQWTEEEGSKERCGILGSKIRTSPSNAAFVNGFLGHLQDYDDTHFPTILHPTSVVWPAALAVTEDLKLSGEQLLLNFILGAEVACRVAISVHPWHYDQGWHITGTAGVFGAATSAANLLDLEHQEFLYALGGAGTLASGVREVFGSHTKPIHPGHSASVGVRSAYLAGLGLNSADDIIGGRRGFWAVLSPNGHSEEKLLNDLGRYWEFKNNGLKPYANGVVSHPLQDAAIQLRNEHNIKPDHIKMIHVEVHPLVPELMGHRKPRRGLEGKFSFYHCIAAGILYGSGHDAQFSDECVASEAIESIRSKISYEVDNSMKEEEVKLTIELNDGSQFKKHIQHATGSPENPMSDEFLKNKYYSLSVPVVGEERATKIFDLVSQIEASKDLSELMELLN